MGKFKVSFNKRKCPNRCSLDRCKNLNRAKFIDLSACDLDYFPEKLQEINNLKKLDLHNNNIKIIKNLEIMPKLEYLNLGLNEISKIEGLDKLPKLKTLRLHSNKISKIENLEKLQQLEFLDLRYNQIEWIEGLGYLDNAKKIALDGNPLQSNLERKMVDLGFEFDAVGVRLRENEIADAMVGYSVRNYQDTLLSLAAHQIRRSAIKARNSILGE